MSLERFLPTHKSGKGTTLYYDNVFYRLTEGKIGVIEKDEEDPIFELMEVFEETKHLVEETIDGEEKVYAAELDGDDYEVFTETKKVLKNGQPIGLTEALDPKIEKLMSSLMELDVAEVKKDEDTGEETIDIPGEESDVVVGEESGEPEVAIAGSAMTEEDEAVKAESELLVDKLEEIDSNISKLEEIDISTRDDYQQIYIEEVGKRTILKERLEELGTESEESEKTIVDSLLENYSYLALKKLSNRTAILHETNIGNIVYDHVLGLSKEVFLENIKTKGNFEYDNIKVGYHPKDKNFLLTGEGIARLTEDKVLVIESEAALFESISTLFVNKPANSVDNTKRIKLSKYVDVKKKLLENRLAGKGALLEDNTMYKTKCDIYSNNFTKEYGIFLEANSFLVFNKNTILRYNKENDVFVDENKNIHSVGDGFSKFVESHQEVVVSGMKPGDKFTNITNGAVYKFVESVHIPNTIGRGITIEDSLGDYVSLTESQAIHNLAYPK